MDENTSTQSTVIATATADLKEETNRLLAEMQAQRYQFEIEAQEDVDAIEEDFMNTRHFLHVTDEAINEELAQGLKDVNDAGDAIDLGDDDEDIE